MKRRRARSYLLGFSAALVGTLLVGIQSVRSAPILEYRFPDSWDGVATTVTDVSGAGNNGTLAGTPALSANVPPGAPAGSQSADTSSGGFRTDNTALLTNDDIAAAGGFRFDTTFMWSGANNAFSVHKIIDYAGTEFLQLQDIDTVNGIATLRFGFNDDPAVGANLVTTINANQWYDVSGIFDTQGNSVAGDGSLAGQATLIVNGSTFVDNVSKSNFGDGLNRPIGIGTFSASGSGIIELEGNIFSASVELIPEPASAAMWLVAGVGTLVLRWRRGRIG